MAGLPVLAIASDATAELMLPNISLGNFEAYGQVHNVTRAFRNLTLIYRDTPTFAMCRYWVAGGLRTHRFVSGDGGLEARVGVAKAIAIEIESILYGAQ